MYSLLFLAVVSFLLALVLTPVVRDLFNRLGVVDVPDSARKFHSHPIPRVGGIAIVLSLGLSASLLLLAPSQGERLIVQASPLIGRLMPAAAVIFFLGLFDDLIRLKPWQKLGGQAAAAIIAYLAGVRVLGVGGAALSAWSTLPITVFWLVGCCNAVNLIDGVDGLAAGVSFVAVATMLLAAALQHNLPLALATVPLAGCLLGFLRYNFSPASIFLGDCGSLFIGFLLGCYGVLWSEKSTTILGMTAPLIALSLPLADTGLAIARRFLRGQPLFQGDRGHIHHRLLDLKLTPRKAVLILYGVCAIAAVFSLCMSKEYFEVPVLLLFGILAWLGLQRLGYVEFDAMAHLLRHGSFRRLLRAEIALRDFEAKLAVASTAAAFWEALRESYAAFGLSQIHMRLDGKTYFAGPDMRARRRTWELVIPLDDGDFVELTRCASAGANDAVTVFADAILRALEAKPASFIIRRVLSRAAAAGD